MVQIKVSPDVSPAAKARENGWMANGKHPQKKPLDTFGQPIEDGFQRTGSDSHTWFERAKEKGKWILGRAMLRARSLGRVGQVVVHHPPRSILLTKERKEEKQKLRQRQRPKRIRFKLPKIRTASYIKALDQHATPVERWRMFMAVPLCFEMWAFPYRLGFGSAGGGDLFILLSDIVCDCFFAFDFIFSLFIRIPALTYRNQPEAITTLRSIFPKRFKHDLPALVIPALIYYIITTTVEPDSDTGRWLWWASTLPRLATRFDRLIRYFRSMETNLDISVRTLQAIKFVLIIFLSCHWVGCIFFFLSRLNSFDNTTWVKEFETLLPLYDREESSTAMHYLLCLYKGFNGLSNLGYDQGLPQNAVEMMWGLLVMGLQVYLTALILGTLLNFLVTKDPVAEAYKKRVEDLGLFMESKQLPGELRERIFEHMRFQYEKNVQTKEVAGLHLPHSLRVKVADAKYRGIIAKCQNRGKPFCGCNPQFINTVMTKLTVMHVMAGEEITKKGDIPRELYFVLDGTLHVIDEDNRVKSVIRNDVPDMAPVAGEVPFFLGINHMSNIRARPDGSVQLLKLSKEDSIEIFATYPEEFDVICANLLAKYDLDLKGQAIGGGEDGGEEVVELDADTQELKKAVMESLKLRRERRFVSLLQSVANGDVEAVQMAVRQGAEIDQRNYDGRSILHMASAEGNYKMVEMLLEQGADKDCLDRWGRTPLAEAILNRQSLVAGLLAQYKGSLAMENPAGALCEFAGSGDVEQVRRLVENNINPDAADYDGRCALHISSAEGHDKVVEYILSRKANPNATDRWGGTPLLDAVRNGHVVSASLLRAKGAQMPQMVGADEVCGAAGTGDVKKLRLLHDCGEPMDVCDYDSRYPLHLAAAEARILAVSFLLGISTDPNCQDRWGGSPLDDALRGGTLYHLYCAKLIQGWGGELGSLAGTEEGETKLKELEEVSIKDVRLVIRDLISKGYDKEVPKRTSEEEMLVAREASLELLDCTHQLRHAMEAVNVQVGELAAKIRGEGKLLRDSVSRLTLGVAAAGYKGLGRASTNTRRWGPRSTTREEAADRESEMSLATTAEGRGGRWASEELSPGPDSDSPPSPMGGVVAGNLIRNCQEKLAAQDSEDEDGRAGDEGNLDLDEADLDMGLDSDEELQLHAEIDALLEAQERSHVSGLTGERMAAKTFQKVALHIVQYESAFETLSSFAHIGRAKRGILEAKIQRNSSSGGSPTWEPSLACEDISWLLDALQAKSTVDATEIFDEAAMRDATSLLPYNAKPHRDNHRDAFNDPSIAVPLSSLIARSKSFRHAVSGIKTDPRLVGVMKTRIGHMLREHQVRLLLVAAKDAHLKAGEMVMDMAEGHEAERGAVSSKAWVVVLEGELKLSVVAEKVKDPKDKAAATEEKLVGTGDFFGVELGLRKTKKPTFRVEAVTGCHVVELPLVNLQQLADEDSEVLKLLRSTKEAVEKAEVPSPVRKEVRSPVANLRQTFKRQMTRQGGLFGKSMALLHPRSPPVKAQSPPGFQPEAFELAEDNIGTGAGERSEMNELERIEVHKMIAQISDVWRNLAQGQQTLNISQVRGLARHLGEVGSELFKELFYSPKRVYKDELTETSFWELWVSFFREEVFGSDKEQRENRRKSLTSSTMGPEMMLRLQEEEEQEAARQQMIEDELNDEPDTFFEKLHSRFAPARRLRHRFFEDDVIEHYEKAFVQVVGSLETNLETKFVPPFLAHVFVDHPYKISKYNVAEFFEAFLRDKSADAKFISWNDISKVLRERRMGLWIDGEGSRAMIGTCFHPHSQNMKRWKALVRLVAVYQFVMVPVRACFLPWDSMTHPTALAADIPGDAIAFLNLLVSVSTAYKNSKSVWITSRMKLMRRMNPFYAAAAIPLDWFAHLCGASNEAACILRFNKMLLLLGAMRKAGLKADSKSHSGKVVQMLCVVGVTLHLAACGWFFIGSHYKYWVEDGRAVSWLLVSEELAHVTYGRDEHFAMEEGATTWEEYLLSLYWVAATFTVNGVIGDLLPQNPLELAFTIALCALNMTLLRLVVGEISTIVMSSNKEIVKAREQLEAVDQFLSGNNLPEELEKEIRVHFRTLQAGSSVDQEDLMSGISYSLKVEVAALTSREYLEGVDLFAGCSQRLVEDVSVLLNEHQFGPEEHLFYAGAAAKQMYFVVSGVVEEMVENEEGEQVVENVRRAHQAVGSIPFVFGLRHFNSARASGLGGAVCLRLEREQFFDMLKMYPADEEILSTNAMASLDAIKSKAGSSRRSGSKAGGSVVSSKSGVSSIAGRDGPEGSVAPSAGGGSRVASGSEREKDINTESGDGSGASDELEALVGSNMKEKISALKTRRKREKVNLLLTAAKLGDVQKLQKIISASVTVNTVDTNKRTPLHVAASEGHVEAILALLDMRADVTLKDAFGNTPFNDAVREKRDAAVKVLRESNETVRLSMPGCAAAVMMCEEAHAGNLEQVRRLVENGVNVNDADYDGRTALHLAVCEGQEPVVRYLLDKNANVHAEDRFGGTPIEDAIRHDKVAMQKLLLEFGATLEEGGNYAGKLCQYSSEGNLHGVETLHRNGFDVTEGDYDQRTALHLAAANDKVSVLEYLLTLKPPINVNLVDRFGGTPLDDAIRHGSTAAIAMLKRRGCVTSQDPELPKALEQQRRVEQARGQVRRRGPVERKVKHSPEGAALVLVREKLVPEMHKRGLELSEALAQLMLRVQAALAVVAQRRVEEHTTSDPDGGDFGVATLAQGFDVEPGPLPGLVMDVLERIESNGEAEELARMQSSSTSGGQDAQPASNGEELRNLPPQLQEEEWTANSAATTKSAWGVKVKIPGVDAITEGAAAGDEAVTAIIRSDDAVVRGTVSMKSNGGAGGPVTGSLRLVTDGLDGFVSPGVAVKQEMPVYESVMEAAEAVIEQGKEVRAVAAELKKLLQLEAVNNGGAPIDCLTWKALTRSYERECTAVYVQIRRAVDVAGVSRKLMKGVIKVVKRRAQLRGEMAPDRAGS